MWWRNQVNSQGKVPFPTSSCGTFPKWDIKFIILFNFCRSVVLPVKSFTGGMLISCIWANKWALATLHGIEPICGFEHYSYRVWACLYVSEAGQKVQIYAIPYSSNSMIATTSQEANQIPKPRLFTECTPHFGVNLEVEAEEHFSLHWFSCLTRW